MDKVGRLVLPKRMREELGLSENTEFDAEVDGTAIRLQPRASQDRKIRVVDGWPVLTAVAGQPFTDDDVRGLRDSDQR